MANVSLTIKDELFNEVLDAFDLLFLRDEADSKQAHLKKIVTAYVKERLMEARRRKAVDAAIGTITDPGAL
jgi:hypothetical protein